MLRTSLRSVRLISGKPIAAAPARQWPTAVSRQASISGKRYYAEQKNDPSKPPVLPASETLTSERTPPPPPASYKVFDTKLADPPLEPPPPPPVNTAKPAPTATIDDVGESVAAHGETAAPPPPPPKKGFFRRLRNFVFTLMVLGAVGFAGGAWYSRINDTFHDFFTEYIPFGEQAVLYLEEREFRQRFPQSPRSSTKPAGTSDPHVKIPASNGASWRVADGPSSRQTSASPSEKKAEAPPAPAPAPAAPPAETFTAATAKTVGASASKAAADDFKAPEVNEPSKFPPLKPIDLMALADAREPVVRDLVHMLNDLILVINADDAHGKYGTTINKAKTEITKVGGRLRDIKKGVEKKAAKEVKVKIDEFDKAATELIERVEKAMVGQEIKWRQDFESEMKSVRDGYDERVKLLMERESQLNAEKLQNKLLEQAIALKKEFVQEVEAKVEQEREGRLGQLSQLSSAVSQLEKLTLGWNDVVDSNLQTQQLHVAVEAVRASLEDGAHPRPFIRELVALKEIGAEDPVIDAAIASVNPTAYQRGIPTSAQLIDRFRRVAGEVRKASLLPDEAGVASHASSWVLSHVMFKKQGLAEGGDVESILTRTQTYLEEGDLDAAAREMNGLDGWAKTLSKDWIGEVRKVLEVHQALDVIATEARLQSLRVD